MRSPARAVKVLFGLAITVGLALIAVAQEPVPAPANIEQSSLTQAEARSLLSGSGEQLYAQFCASCHGADGTGNPLAVEALEVAPPDLTRLSSRESSGRFPALYVQYVLTHPVQVEGHVAQGELVTMPNWGRVFRHALGNDAAAAMPVHRLTGYLESIQVQ